MVLHKKNNQIGISFIEILIVLFLASLMLSFAMPRFLATQKGRLKKEFYKEFCMLVSDTMYQAVISKKVHQIFWDLGKHEISVKIYDADSEEKSKHAKFKPVTNGMFREKIELPESFVIHNFFIKDEDQVQSNKNLTTVFSYIMPDGTSQQVLVNIEDEHEETNNRFAIKINPFCSQVSLHDDFEKL